MRTTVELKPEHRSRLLAIAARRGQKGFSAVLEEAIEAYLHGEQERQRRRRRALELKGVLDAGEAEELRAATARLRASWR